VGREFQEETRRLRAVSRRFLLFRGSETDESGCRWERWATRMRRKSRRLPAKTRRRVETLPLKETSKTAEDDEERRKMSHSKF